MYLIAGEASGDVLGAKLMAALKRRAGGELSFAGAGGERMIVEGLDSLFPIADIAVNGLVEVLPSLPRVFRRIDETVKDIERRRPAVIVTIDAPGFCLRVAERVRKLGIPVVHYVAPQVWAWRAGRARKLGRHVDYLMTLLPNEAALFGRHGLPSTYVGHPVVEDRLVPADSAAWRARHGIPDSARLIVMAPGSRSHVLRRMLPLFAAAIETLYRRRRDFVVAVTAVAATEPAVQAAAAGWAFPSVVVRDAKDKRDAFAAAAAALSMTGTGTLELAIADVPMIVSSRVSLMTAILAWLLVQVRHYSLPNVLLERTLVPELLQFAATPTRLADALERLLDDQPMQAAQRAGFAELRAILSPSANGSDGLMPSDRAAAVVLEAVRSARPTGA